MAIVQQGSGIRKLTDEERDLYGGAVVRAVRIIPAFRDAVALMRAFFDPTASTAYTDKFSRVGLGSWFFEDLDNAGRAGVVLHECMHVLNNHFVRAEAINASSKLMNVAGDFEINSGLSTISKVDLGDAILPDKAPFSYPKFLSMEKYLHLLKADSPPCPQHGENGKDEDNDPQSGQSNEDGSNDGNKGEEGSEGSQSGQQGSDSQDGGSQDSDSEDGQQGDGSQDGQQGGSDGQDSSDGDHSHGAQSGSQGNQRPCTCDTRKKPQGRTCDEASEDRSTAADEAGIERASEVEQSIAKKNAIARISEERTLAKSRGDGEMDMFLSMAEMMMQPAKVPWQSIFRRVVSKSNDAIIRGRADYSYRRVNRRSHSSEFIFPGMVQYQPTVMFGIDTSGSMAKDDYLALLSEVEGILKASGKTKGGLKVFNVDTTIKNIALVNSVSKVSLRGGGGTDMSVAWKYVNSLSKKERSDVFVLATDGGTDWGAVEQELLAAKGEYISIILVTNKMGFDSAPQSVRKLANVINCALD